VNQLASASRSWFMWALGGGCADVGMGLVVVWDVSGDRSRVCDQLVGMRSATLLVRWGGWRGVRLHDRLWWLNCSVVMVHEAELWSVVGGGSSATIVTEAGRWVEVGFRFTIGVRVCACRCA